MKLELIPLLIIALLMISAGGEQVQSVEIVLEGDHTVDEHTGALIVGDADVDIPAGAEVPGPIYVIGGELRVDGTVEGNLTQLSGSLIVSDTGEIGGELLYVSGREELDPDAVVGTRSTIDPTPQEPGPIGTYLPWMFTTALLAVTGGVLASRRGILLDNVGTTVAEHPLVSLTVGALLFVTGLALFVFMAFTLVLIPVTILGLLVLVVIVAYGIIAIGHHVGRLTPFKAVRATMVGIVGVMLLFELVRLIPFIGDFVVFLVLLAGFGGVLLSYFGFTTFEPPKLPEH